MSAPAIDWAGHTPAPAALPADDIAPVACPVCKGAGAIQHGSRNPELITDCTACGGDGQAAA